MGSYNEVTSNGGATVTLTIAGSCTIAAGHTVLVTASEVTNPATTSTGDVVTVSTSSDTTPAHTNTYAITATKAVTAPSVTLSTTAAGATNVTYATSFTTSSTGALAPYYSTITLAAPAGTVFNSNSSYTIEDVTTGTQCGYYNAVTSNGGATVTLTDGSGCGTIAGGHTVLVTASDVSNPATTSTGERHHRLDLLGHAPGPDQHLRHHGSQGGGLTVGHPLDQGGRRDQRHLQCPVHHLVDGIARAVLLDDHPGRPGGHRLQLEQFLHDRRRHDRNPVRKLQRGHEQRRRHGSLEPVRQLRHHRRRRHGAGHGERSLQPGDDVER